MYAFKLFNIKSGKPIAFVFAGEKGVGDGLMFEWMIGRSMISNNQLLKNEGIYICVEWMSYFPSNSASRFQLSSHS